MEMERKAVEAELKSLNDQGEGVLRFIKFNQEDKDADITLPGFVGRQKAVLLAAHNWKSDYPPLGHGESYEADGGTNFKFRLNMQDERAKAWHSWLKMDRETGLQQVSYGFSPYADATERWQKDGRAGRYLKPRKDGSPGSKLHEVSFVVVGSGNDTAVLHIKALDDLPEPETADDLKAAGIQIQSLVFPKDKWESAEAVRAWLSSHDYTTTLDTTGASWRARQEDPSKFIRLRSFCINPGRDASSESCRVMAVGGPMKESRSMESEEPRVEAAAEGKQEDVTAEIEDWTKYPEDRRPPLPVLIKWLRLYRYHMPFLQDIRKRDQKDISPETIREFKALIEESIEVAAQLGIALINADRMPTAEEQALLQQQYASRFHELTADVNAQQELAYQQLQAQAEELAREARVRSARMKELHL